MFLFMGFIPGKIKFWKYGLVLSKANILKLCEYEYCHIVKLS